MQQTATHLLIKEIPQNSEQHLLKKVIWEGVAKPWTTNNNRMQHGIELTAVNLEKIK